MEDGLQNGWVRNVIDESLSCMGRWLKTIMKQVIAVVKKGIELGEQISNAGFCIYGIWS
jgi:hypothetical protein